MTDTLGYLSQPPRWFKGEARSRLCGKGLTETDVRAIRADTRSMAAIGAQYDISAPMVHHIKHRRRWAHVAD